VQFHRYHSAVPDPSKARPWHRRNKRNAVRPVLHAAVAQPVLVQPIAPPAAETFPDPLRPRRVPIAPPATVQAVRSRTLRRRATPFLRHRRVQERQQPEPVVLKGDAFVSPVPIRDANRTVD